MWKMLLYRLTVWINGFYELRNVENVNLWTNSMEKCAL